MYNLQTRFHNKKSFLMICAHLVICQRVSHPAVKSCFIRVTVLLEYLDLNWRAPSPYMHPWVFNLIRFKPQKGSPKVMTTLSGKTHDNNTIEASK